MKKINVLKTVTLVAAGLIGGLISALVVFAVVKNPAPAEQQNQPATVATAGIPVRTAAFTPGGEPVNFSDAAETAVSSVVHVKVMKKMRYHNQSPFGSRRRGGDWLDWFFGNPESEQDYGTYTQPTAGSGVIISPDGYIVTNNHVVDMAVEVTVTLNDKTTLSAKVVGKDPTTDIAVLKVESDHSLPTLKFGDSDNLRIGEWVLAVGNPFNLTSTVTSGIVSAKARHLGLSGREGDKSSIEAFIQTDAVVNPGNSGGALVNLNSELVGINTAIATHTGTYEGYAFAVPSNLVKKVVDDIIKYGSAQRAWLGISLLDLNDLTSPETNDPKYDEYLKSLKEDLGISGVDELERLKKYKGVYVGEVNTKSAAEEAGIQKGDIITHIDNKEITSQSSLIEEIAKKRPGDKIEIIAIRSGKTKHFTALLRNNSGTTKLVSTNESEILGAKFQEVNKTLAERLNIKGGLQIVEIFEGNLKNEGIKKDFIITRVNRQSVSSMEDLANILNGVKKGEGVFIEGIYPDGQKRFIAFGIE